MLLRYDWDLMKNQGWGTGVGKLGGVEMRLMRGIGI